MSQDIDLDQLVDLLDKALTSKDPNVAKALKKFLFIAALASDDQVEEKGPFTKIMEKIEMLEARLRMLEHNGFQTTTFPHTGTWYGGTSTSGSGPWQLYNVSGTSTASYEVYDVEPVSTTFTYTSPASVGSNIQFPLSAEEKASAISDALGDIEKIANSLS